MVKHKFDSAGINSRTLRTALRIMSQKKLVQSFENDPKKELRIKEQRCVVCFYTTQICGQGFTKYTCQNCGQEEMWHNTCVPLLCCKCAQNLDACIKCGADINLEKRG